MRQENIIFGERHFSQTPNNQERKGRIGQKCTFVDSGGFYRSFFTFVLSPQSECAGDRNLSSDQRDTASDNEAAPGQLRSALRSFKFPLSHAGIRFGQHAFRQRPSHRS